MKDYSNYLNQKFAKLTILKFVGLNKRKEPLFECICSCGGTTVVKYYNLKIGRTKSCGCLKTGPQRKDIVNKKFNRLLVLEYIGRGKDRGSIYRCKCECGNIKEIRYGDIINGRTKSCGCFNKEQKSRNVGPLSPTYKINISDQDRQDRRNFKEYRAWAKKVKEKDNYKCQICYLSPSGKLTSHHLYSYNKYRRLRALVSNGVCLCVKHHKLFHKIYGNGNNTKPQFVEYKESLNEQTNGRDSRDS